MKKTLFLLLLCIPFVMHAQFLADYTFATGTDSTKWTDMSDAMEILSPEGSDNLASNVEDIGFVFPFGEGVYTQYSVNTDGNLRLGGTVTGTLNSSTPFSPSQVNRNNPKINGFGCDGYGVPCRHYVKAKLFGDTMLVVEFSMGTDNTLTRNNQFKWQVHLHSNGNIDIVYPPASLMPANPPYVTHQCGMCVDNSDGWIIRHQSSGEYIASFSNGDTATNAAGSWFDAGRYYSFFRPVIYCPRPEYIDAITGINEMTVFWPREGVESSWEVVFDSVSHYTTDTFYTFNGLDANTLYSVSVRSVCTTGATSVYRTNSFRTRCHPISSLPYIHDFEEDPYYNDVTYADAFPLCWRRVISDTNTTIQSEVSGYYASQIVPYVTSYNNYVIHGENSLYWYSGMPYNEYAVLPAIDRDSIDINGLFLSFYGVNTSLGVPPPQFIVGVMDGDTAVSTFTPVDTVTLANTPTLYVVSLSNYGGTGSNIAFKCPRTLEPCMVLLDDVTLNDGWCPVPDNVTAMSGSNDVTISWESNGGTSFSVFLGGDTTGGILDTFYTFHNLLTDVEYSYGVATECGDSTSFYQTGTFRTQCPFLDNLPYREGFENVPAYGYNSASFVPCMSRLNNGSIYNGFPYVSDLSIYCHDGIHGLCWENNTTPISYGDYQCIVLPGVDTNVYEMNSLQMKFWAKRLTPFTSVFQVGVMTNHNDINSFQLLQTIEVDDYEWAEYVVSLEDFEGYGNRIAIRALRADTTFFVAVDDITVEVTPHCPGITGLTAEATVGGAMLSWDYQSGFDAPNIYEVSYYAVDDTNVITIPVTERYVVLNGLNAVTAYRAYVRARCDIDDYGLSSGILFHTKDFNCVGIGSATGIDSLDNGGDTCHYVPINNDYEYSYTQELVLASELGGSTVLTGIDFEYIDTAQMNAKDEVVIYLANISDTTLARGFVPYSSEFVQVYEGDLNCHQGWNHFEFDTPFNYYGTSNLLIVIADHSGSYDGRLHSFKAHPASDMARIYTSILDYNVNTLSSSSGSLSPYRSNMRLHRADCTTLSTCAAPAVTVADVRDTMVEIVWVPGYNEVSWDLAYREFGNTIWTTVATGVSATSYSFTGLNPSTEYEFRVQFQCGTNDIVYSTFVMAATQCTPLSIPYFEDFEGITSEIYTQNVFMDCWDYKTDFSFDIVVPPNVNYGQDYASSGQYSLRFSSNSYVMMPPVPVSLDNLQIMFSHYTYNGTCMLEVGVMEGNLFIPVDTILSPVRTITEHLVTFENYHGNSRIIAFHNISYQCIDDIAIDYLQSCPHVRALTASTQGDEVTLNWSSFGSESHWVVSYDSASDVVNDNTYTATGLAPSTEYTFTVQPLCSIGDTGEGRSVTITTHCMSISMPFFENFDSLAAGSYPSCWLYVMTGPAVYQSGVYLPKVKADNYYSNSGSHCLMLHGEGYYMLPEFDVPLDTLKLTFSTFRTSGYDLLDVGVIEDNTFVPVRAIDYPQNSHSNQTVYFTDYSGDSRVIAFRNRNMMSSVLHTSIHYIDDILVDYIEVCHPVENLRCFDVTTNTAGIEWDDFLPADRWEVEYGTAGFTPGHGTRIEIFSHPYIISDLDASTEYDVYVRTLCSDMDTGDRVMMTIRTSMCDSVVEFYTGDSTGTTYYSPINNYFKYTLTETIIDSAELNGIVDITSITYLFSGNSATSTKNNVDIYIQPTDKTVFSDINDAVALDDSTAVRVYHGRLNCSPGWNLIQLDNLYRWDGHSNLVVIIDDNSGNFNVSMAKFSVTHCVGAKSLVYYSDVYNPAVQNLSAYAGDKRIFEYRPTMKLLGCGNAVCQSPICDTVGNITYNSATITWSGNSTTYEVAVKPIHEGVWPDGITVTNAMSYTFTGLEASTLYQFRVRAECDGLEGVNSGWATGTFTTAAMPCFEPSDITTEASYDAVTVDWTVNGIEGMWNIHIWNSGKDTVVTVTTHPATVGGLAQTTTYNVAVKALCDGGYDESEYCDTVSFTTQTCAPVSDVTVSDVNQYGATVTWSGTTQRYDIEYGEHGFGQGQGTLIENIINQPYTIIRLHANTQYDVYIRSRCDDHNVSDWSPVVSFTTTTGEGVTSPEGISMTIFPNPTSTSTTIRLGGMSGDVRISIIDLNGRTVMEETLQCENGYAKQLEVSGLASGAYFVRVSGEDINIVKKLVVH